MNGEVTNYNEEQNQNSKNKGLVAIIVVLIIIIAALVAFIFINNNKANDDKKVETSEEIEVDDENPTEEEENNVTFENLNYTAKCENKLKDGETVLYTTSFDASKYNDIKEYLKAQNNLTGNLVYNYLDQTQNYRSTNRALTKEQVDSILNEMDNTLVTNAGVGGVNEAVLELKYTKGDKQLVVRFSFLHAISTTDGDLLRFMDTKITANGSCTYAIENLGSTITSLVGELSSSVG